MSFLSQYGLFFLEVFTLVIAFLLTLAGIIALVSKDKHKPALSIKPLHKKMQEMKDKMHDEILDKKALKQLKKQNKKNKEKKKEISNVYVIDFYGDIKASSVEGLRNEITAILSVAKPTDKVIIKLESAGGTVNGYGLAASQLDRLRKHKIPLTVCIDKIAASGGYLMAAVAKEIIAAPFAIIGSIGVVAQMPNFHRWLKKHNIDFELLTAGEYKRTLTVLGENTEKGREKFNEDLEAIHLLFKDHISTHRKQVVIEKVATGEHWLAKDAHELKLIDKLMTSDEYILNHLEQHAIYQVSYRVKTNVVSKLLKPAANLLNPLN